MAPGRSGADLRACAPEKESVSVGVSESDSVCARPTWFPLFVCVSLCARVREYDGNAMAIQSQYLGLGVYGVCVSLPRANTRAVRWQHNHRNSKAVTVSGS